jgi:DNA-binding response OmpR family regulator
MDVSTEKAPIAVITGDEDLLALIRMILASDSLELHVAGTGHSGFELLKQLGPKLVILDLSLPDMNGWEFFIQMQLEAGSHDHGGRAPIPVIVLANQASRVDRTFGLQVAQVHDFLIKPFLPSQLRRSVAAALNDQAPRDYHHAISTHGA